MQTQTEQVQQTAESQKQKEKPIAQKIQKDMTIAEVLQSSATKAHKLAQVMTDNGLHCVGCGASTFETLEQGILGHGFTEEKLHEMVAELNAVLDGEEEDEINIPAPAAKEGSDKKEITPVKFTDNAIKKVKELMQSENKKDWGLRVGVVPGGCSGYSYELAFEEKPEENDKILEQEDVKLFVNQDSYEMLDGATVDFVNNLNESGFKFENPNAKSGCGCGKSFS